jgi:ABC-type amino acid transport substrate-binding protein
LAIWHLRVIAALAIGLQYVRHKEADGGGSMRVALFTSLAVFFAAATGGADDLAKLEERGVLRVLAVVTPEEPYFIADHPRGGFDWELLSGFAALQKVKLELVTVRGWDALIPALLARQGDVIAGGFTDTPSRRKQIAFTAETFPTRSVVITRRPQPAVATLADLAAARIGTLKASFMYEDLLAAGIAPARIDDTIRTGGIPAALRAGTISAGVDGIEAALVAKAKDRELRVDMFLGHPSSLAWGVRKEDVALREALDRYLGNVRRTTTWNRLVVRHFGEAALEILKKARGES